MIEGKKVIICDLDGTLAVSKSALSPEMAETITKVLGKYYFAIISGGAFTQFEKQVISQLQGDPTLFKNLYIFPTMGGMCYAYDAENSVWKKVYDESLTEEERKQIIEA